MDRWARCLVVSAKVLLLLRLAEADTFAVRIVTESHVNQVDSKFVSFTLDPEVLFSSGDKSKGKESVCMAASLTPAFIRIAGPSTSHLTFHNTSISLGDVDVQLPEANKQKRHLKASGEEKESKEAELGGQGLEGSIERHESILSKLKAKLKRSKDAKQDTKNRRGRKDKENLEVSHQQWKRFVKWANDTGFDLVFAVNNGEKTETGMWDPNPALSMLRVADQDGVDSIFWQLGYGCTNQTIEDYLNDLQTLRFMVDSFSERRWKVVGGDVSGCLQEGSKSDFKDYVTLSSEMMDAVLLNGNSASRSLSRMSAGARAALLRTLSSSRAALWLTAPPQPLGELARAADWLTSLGYSARNGFHVHFRELLESELYEPTLSFYMALLFKSLVGERVLDLTMESSESSENNAAIFAHCASLRHKAVPGAVTLYGVNMDSEAARFSVKLTKREDGGDIMQFILGHDHNGNIAVNGRPMVYEGDIRPVVKRVRPFKTLLLNLPPKTFGFWVLSNTKVNACFDYEDEDDIKLVEAKPVNDTKVNEQNKTESIDDASDKDKERVKRYVEFESDFDLTGSNNINNDEALKNRIDSMNKGLKDIQGWFGSNDKFLERRVKRQIFDEDGRMKLRKLNLKKFKQEHESLGSGIFEKIRNNIMNNIPKLNLTRNLKDLKLRKPKLNQNKLSKRHSRNYRNKVEDSEESVKDEFLSRRRRSVFTTTSKNEIDTDDKKYHKFGKFLGRQKKIKDMIEKHDEKDQLYDQSNEDQSNGDVHDKIDINTKITDDYDVFKSTENADHGLLKNTFENVLSLLEELNNNLSKLWTALSFLQ